MKIFLSVITGIMWASWPLIASRMNVGGGWVLMSLGVVCFAGGVLQSLVKGETIPDSKGLWLLLLCGLINTAGTFVYTYLLTNFPSQAGIWIALTTAVIAVSGVVMASYFLNETITLRQWTGVAFGVVGIVLISVK